MQLRQFKILAVIPVSDSPSSMIFAKRQVEALRSRGHEVAVAELKNRRTIFGLALGFVELRKQAKLNRYDIIHAHYGAATGLLGVMAAWGLARSVVSFRGSDLNPVPSAPYWKMLPSHALSHLAAALATRSVCVSRELQRRVRWGRMRSTVIPTGVDTTKFYPADQRLARQRLGWPIDRPVVLFNAGRAPEVKRFDRAALVIESTKRVVPDLEFVVLDGSNEPDLVPTMMQASDCLLFTSDYEGSPTVIQEAMACNLPIVSVPVGDVPERLKGVSHSFVLEWNVGAMATLLAGVLKQKPRTNGYDLVQRELGNEAIVSQLERVYALALAR